MKLFLPKLLRRALLSAMMSGFAGVAFSATGVWTGNTDSEISKPENWTNNVNFMSSAGTNIAVLSGDVANKNLTVSAGNTLDNHLAFGGITIEAGAVGYSIVGGGSYQRGLNLNAGYASNGRSYCLLDIKEDFAINANKLTVIARSNIDMKVAEGKTLTLNAPILALASAGQHTISIYGGGTVALNSIGNASTALPSGWAAGTAVALNYHWDLGADSTLTLAGLTQENKTDALGTGNIIFNGGSLQMYSGVATLSNRIQVGSLGGTISGCDSITLSGGLSYSSTQPGAFLDFGNINVTLADNLNVSFQIGVEAGQYTFLSTTGTLTVDTTNFVVDGLSVRQGVSWSSSGGKLIATIEGSVADLIWAGGNGSWGQGMATDAEWNADPSVTNKHFQKYDKVTFGTDADVAGNSTDITLVSNVTPTSITVVGAADWNLNANESFKITGAGSLTMNGTGTLTIGMANDYSGGTIVNSGILNANVANALGVGALEIKGGIVNIGATQSLSGVSVDANGTLNLGSLDVFNSFGAGAIINNGLVSLSINGNMSGSAISGKFNASSTGTILLDNGKYWQTGGFLGALNCDLIVGSNAQIAPSGSHTKTITIQGHGYAAATGSEKNGAIKFASKASLSKVVLAADSSVTIWTGETGTIQTLQLDGHELGLYNQGTLVINNIVDEDGTGVLKLMGGTEGSGQSQGTFRYDTNGTGTFSTKVIASGGVLGFGGTGTKILDADLSEFTGTVNVAAGTMVLDCALTQNITVNGTLMFGQNGSTTGNITLLANGGLSAGVEGLDLDKTILISDANANLGAVGDGLLKITSLNETNFNAIHTLNIYSDVHTGTYARGGYQQTISIAGGSLFEMDLFTATGGGAANVIVNRLNDTEGVSTMKINQLGTISNTGWKFTLNDNTMLEFGFSAENSATLTNIVTGAGSVKMSGEGTLTLAGNNTYTGGTYISNGTVLLNHASGAGTGTIYVQGGNLNANNLAIANKVQIAEGSISNAGAMTNTVIINQFDNDNKVTHTGAINLGSLNGNKIESINLGADLVNDKAGTISGVTGNIQLSNASMGITSNMINIAGTDVNATSQVIDFGTSTGSLDISGKLSLSFTDELCKLLVDNTDKSFTIQLTNDGNVSIANNFDISVSSSYNIITSWYKLDANALSSTDGTIKFVWDPQNASLLNVQSNTEFDIDSLNQVGLDVYDRVLVNGTLNVNINEVSAGNDTLLLKGLEGMDANGSINSSHSSAGLTIQLGQAGGAATNNQYTYQGSITGNAQIEKIDSHKLIIGGTVDTTKLSVQNGTLEINGNLTIKDTSSLLGDVSTASGDLNVGANGSLVLNGLENRIAGTINLDGKLSINGKSSETNAKELIVNQGGALTLNNGSLLTITNGDASIGGTVSGNGTLSIQDGILSLAGNGSIGDEIGVQLGAQGIVDASRHISFGALNGIGTIQGNAVRDNAASLELKNGSGLFEGSYDGYGTIVKNGSGEQSLIGSSGSENFNLSVVNGQLNVLSGTFGDVSASSGGVLGVTYQWDAAQPVVSFNSLNMNSGAMVISSNLDSIEQLKNSPILQVSDGISMVDSTVEIKNTGALDITSLGAEFSFTLFETDNTNSIVWENNQFVTGIMGIFYDMSIEIDGNKVIVSAREESVNTLAPVATSNNALAGANMIYEGRYASNANKDTSLFALTDAVARLVQSGNHSVASDVMAAAAGSALTSYGAAQLSSLQSQMGWLRNRITYLGIDQQLINEDLPYFNMWIQGIGSYDKLDQKGHDSGYSLSSWGGAVGVDVDLSERTTVGIAFTSMFGDLDAHAIDRGKGDLDAYYLSLFARYRKGAWNHSLLATGGWNDGKLRRTVDYQDDIYTAHSSSNGYGIGAMYELTYDYVLNEDASSILQPLLNVSFSHTSMDGFDETGADLAGLRAGKQDMSVATIALGGRWLCSMGQNLFGRSANSELRINVAQDLGDDRSKVDVGFLGNANYTQRVQGAKIGKTALQLGAGFQLPVGERSSFFVDANADFRSGASSASGSVGYRYNF